jgi:transcriptional regulator with XRE-family HTH domain
MKKTTTKRNGALASEAQVPPNTLGELIQLRREEMGISMRELARRVKVANSFLSLLERDRSFPSAKLLNRIADELGLPLSELQKRDTRFRFADLRRVVERHSELRFALRSAVQQLKSGELTVEEFTRRVAGNSR